MMRRNYFKRKREWVERGELLRAKQKSRIYEKPGAWWQKIVANSNMDASSSAGLGGQVSALSAVVTSAHWIPVGICFVCGKMGHFKKSCPISLKAQYTSNNI